MATGVSGDLRLGTVFTGEISKSFQTSLREIKAIVDAYSKALTGSIPAIQKQTTAINASIKGTTAKARALSILSKQLALGDITWQQYQKRVELVSGTQKTMATTVQKSTNVMAESITNLRKRVVDVAAAQSKMTQTVGPMAEKLSDVQKRTVNLVKAQTASAQSMKQAATATTAKKRALEILNRQLDAGKITFDRYSKSVAAVTGTYQKTIAPLTKIKSGFSQVHQEISKQPGMLAKTNASLEAHGKQLGRIPGLWHKIRAAAGVTVAYGIAATAIGSLIGAITSGIKTIATFDQHLKSLQAITGASAQEMVLLGEELKNVSRETKFSTEEIGKGMEYMGQAGFTAVETMSAIEAVAKLSTGTLEDMEVTADLLTTTIRAFNLEATDAGRVADVMAIAINLSKLSVDKLRTAFNYVGAMAHTAGLTLEETAASMEILADNGLRASTIGTSLRQVLSNLIDPNRAMNKALQEQNLTATELNPKLVGYSGSLEALAKILVKVQTNADGTTSRVVDMQKAFAIFGLRGAQAAEIMTRAWVSGKFESALKMTMDSIGEAERMASIQGEGLIVTFQNMISRAKLLAVALGDAWVTGALKYFLNALRSTMTFLEGFVQSVGGSMLIKFVAFTAALIGAGKAVVFFAATLKGSAIVSWFADAIYVAKVYFAAMNAGFISAAGAAGGFIATIVTMIGPLTVLAALFAGVYVAVSAFNERFKKAGDAAMKMSLETKASREALEAFEKVISGMKKGSDEYDIALKRLKADEEELTKALQDKAKVTDLATLSQEELIRVINEVETDQLRKQLEEAEKSYENYYKNVERLARQAMFGMRELSLGEFLFGTGDEKLTYDRIKKLAEGNKDLTKALNDLDEAGKVWVDTSVRVEMANGNGQVTLERYLQSMQDGSPMMEAFADTMRSKFIVELNNARFAIEKTDEGMKQLAKDVGPAMAAFYDGLTGADKVDLAEELDKIEKAAKKYQEAAAKMGSSEAEAASIRSQLLARGVAEFVAAKSSEIDSEAEAAQRKLAISEGVYEREKSIRDEAIANEIQKRIMLSQSIIIGEQEKAAKIASIDEKILKLREENAETEKRFAEDAKKYRLEFGRQEIEFEKAKTDEIYEYKKGKYEDTLSTMLDILSSSLESQTGAELAEFDKLFAELGGDAADAAANRALAAIELVAERQKEIIQEDQLATYAFIEKVYGDEVDLAEEKNEAILKNNIDAEKKTLEIYTRQEKNITDLLKRSVEDRIKIQEKLFDVTQKRIDIETKMQQATMKAAQKEKDIKMDLWALDNDTEISTEEYFRKVKELTKESEKAKEDLLIQQQDELRNLDKLATEEERLIKLKEDITAQEEAYKKQLEETQTNIAKMQESIKMMEVDIEFIIDETILEQTKAKLKELGEPVETKHEITTIGKKDLEDSLKLHNELDGKRTDSYHTNHIKIVREESDRWGGLAGDGSKKFAGGGKLPGYGGGDKIDAKLEAGEYVIRKEAVAKYGQGIFHRLNTMKIPDIGGMIKARLGGPIRVPNMVPAFATGGSVSGMQNMGKIELVVANQSVELMGEVDIINKFTTALKRENLMRSN